MVKNKQSATKQVKKYTPNRSKKNFYFYLLDFIRDNSRLPLEDFTAQQLNYYISTLKRLGLIYKIGYTVWNVDVDKYKEYRFAQSKTSKKIHHVGTDNPKDFKPNPLKIIRGHGFVFTLPIKIPEWERREQYMLNKDISYVNIPQGHRIMINGNKIWLCKKSIVVYFKEDLSFYGQTALESLQYAKIEMNKMCKKLENMFKLRLDTGSGYKFNISRNHFARMKDLMAIESNKKNGLKLFYNGKLWCLTDRSFNTDETETVHSKTGQEDQDVVIGTWLNGLKEIKETSGEALNPKDILKAVDGLTKAVRQRDEIIGDYENRIIKLENALTNKDDIYNNDKPDYFG